MDAAHDDSFTLEPLSSYSNLWLPSSNESYSLVFHLQLLSHAKSSINILSTLAQFHRKS